MPLAHGIVPVGCTPLLWDAEAWDGAWLWHHPCAQEGANLESPCKEEHNLHPSLFLAPVLLQVVNFSALKLFIDVVFCFKTK